MLPEYDTSKVVLAAIIKTLTVILNAGKDLIGCVIKNVAKKEDSCIIIFIKSLWWQPQILRCAQDDKQPELLYTICLFRHGNELGVVVKRKAGSVQIPVGFGEEEVLMPYLVNDL